MSKLFYEGLVTNGEDIDVSVSDHDNSEFIGNNFIRCVTDGTIVINVRSGTSMSEDMVAGQFWKVSPKTIKNTSTGTYQLVY